MSRVFRQVLRLELLIIADHHAEGITEGGYVAGVDLEGEVRGLLHGHDFGADAELHVGETAIDPPLELVADAEPPGLDALPLDVLRLIALKVGAGAIPCDNLTLEEREGLIRFGTARTR